MVLLTELRADEEGVVWLGEDEERMVLIHGKKAGVMLKGSSRRKWAKLSNFCFFAQKVSSGMHCVPNF